MQVAKTDTDPEIAAKLAEFRQLVQQRLCKYWSTAPDLGAKVSWSITQLIKQRPAVGWVRADSISVADSQEMLRLRRKIEELEEKLRLAGAQAPVGTQRLAQGDDRFEVQFVFKRRRPKLGKSGQTYWVSAGEGRGAVKLTWDIIFSYLAPSLIEHPQYWAVTHRLAGLVTKHAPDTLFETADERLEEFQVLDQSIQTIKIQFRALGLIAIGDDGEWLLTPYGDNYMTRLLGVLREQPEEGQPG